MTELEKLKQVTFDGQVVELDRVTIDTLTLNELIDRAYALGRSERGEKMPVHVVYRKLRGSESVASKGMFLWFTANVKDACLQLQSEKTFVTKESTIDDARKFWARFGVEIEVKES